MYEMDLWAFRAWLQSCPAEETVGWATQETGCPVARWMNGLYHRDFRVAGNWIYVDDVVPLAFCPPLWVLAFMIELDGRYDCYPVSVSAASALQVLDEMLIELGYGPL